MGDASGASGAHPLVSVVLPTMGRPQELKRAIRSVLRQTFKDFDVWVIDGSPESNAAAVGGFNDPRLNYARAPPKGVNAARNIGITLSKGRYIAFLDDDDEWRPEKLEKQVAFLEGTGRDVAGAFASYIKIDPAKGTAKLVRIWEQGSLIGPHSVGPASVTIVKREVFDDVGLFDEEMVGADDWEMWLKISEKYRWMSLPAVLMDYYITPGGLSSDSYRQIRGHQLMLEKHPYLLQSSRFTAHYYNIVGQALCRRGHMGKGRRYLVLAHRAGRGLYPLVLFAIGTLGGRAYSFAFSSLRNTRVSQMLEKLVERTG